MKSGATRKILLALAASVVLLSTGAFTAGSASAGPYPQAEISRTMFINPYDYTAGPAYLPYAAARKIYLTAGTYEWFVEIYPTYSVLEALFAVRNIYLKSNWYYWRCYVNTVEVDNLGDTAASNYCSLTPTDGSTPTAYLVDTDTSDWAASGAGDYNWYSTLDWLSNP